MATSSKKPTKRETYLNGMRKQSNRTNLFPMFEDALKQVGSNSFEDHVVGFISDTQSSIIANLVYFFETHTNSERNLGDLNKYCENPIDILDKVVEYSDYDLEEVDKDIQAYYCFAVKQLYFAFNIINTYYKDDEIAIVKDILANSKYSFILRDIEKLLYILGQFLPERLYTQEELGAVLSPLDVLSFEKLRSYQFGHPDYQNGFWEVISADFGDIVGEPVDVMLGGALGAGPAIPWATIWEALKRFFKSKPGKLTIAAIIEIVKHWIKKRIDRHFRNKDKRNSNSEEKGEIQDIRGVLGNSDRQEQPPIVPGLIQEKEFVCIFGKEKVGKSFLGIQISRDAEKGGRSSLFPESECSIPKSSVYYYASEGRRDNIGKRFPEGYFDSHPNFKLLISDGQNCNDVICHFRKTLKKQILPDSHNLWVIDNLTSLVGNKTRSGIADSFIDDIDGLMGKADKKGAVLTVILFAHSNAAGDKPLASEYLMQRATNTIQYAKDPKDDTKRTLSIISAGKYYENEVYVFKSIQDAKDRVHYEVIKAEEEQEHTSKPDNPEEKEKEKNAKEIIIIKMALAGKTKMEIHIETGISRPTIDKYWPKDIPTRQSEPPKKSEE